MKDFDRFAIGERFNQLNRLRKIAYIGLVLPVALADGIDGYIHPKREDNRFMAVADKVLRFLGVEILATVRSSSGSHSEGGK